MDRKEALCIVLESAGAEADSCAGEAMKLSSNPRKQKLEQDIADEIRAAIAILSEPVERPEGVPEVVYVGNSGIVEHVPIPGLCRFRFDGIVEGSGEKP